MGKITSSQNANSVYFVSILERFCQKNTFSLKPFCCLFGGSQIDSIVAMTHPKFSIVMLTKFASCYSSSHNRCLRNSNYDFYIFMTFSLLVGSKISLKTTVERISRRRNEQSPISHVSWPIVRFSGPFNEMVSQDERKNTKKKQFYDVIQCLFVYYCEFMPVVNDVTSLSNWFILWMLKKTQFPFKWFVAPLVNRI